MNPRNSLKRFSPQNHSTIILALMILLFIIIFAVATCHTEEETVNQPPSTTVKKKENKNLSALEVPTLKPNEKVIEHAGFVLSYNEKYEEANWVAYILTRKQTSQLNFVRTNKFMKDPLISTRSADEEDYQNSGFDRGHLAPAEDMAWSKKSMAESFYYSNMSPQVPAFNRGVWRRLEELVRFWAGFYDSIYIVTGPVLTQGLPAIGHDKVAVPEYFYKVVLEYNQNETKCIGFLLPNKPSAATLKSFAVPVDSVEKVTGIDFFPKLPDEVENVIEANGNTKNWQWTRSKNTNHNQ